MAFWDDEETSRRKAFDALDSYNIEKVPETGRYRAYNFGKQFDKKICDAFDALAEEGLIEIKYKEPTNYGRDGFAYPIELTKAGIAARWPKN
jgi:hypothetical protein